MPNKCSAPGCKGNYSSTDCYVSVFKLPTDPELRHKWIHVKSDISYKGGKIIAPTLDTEDPLKTVLVIMVSSLHKK